MGKNYSLIKKFIAGIAGIAGAMTMCSCRLDENAIQSVSSVSPKDYNSAYAEIFSQKCYKTVTNPISGKEYAFIANEEVSDRFLATINSTEVCPEVGWKRYLGGKM
jgi:hypothetical protein